MWWFIAFLVVLFLAIALAPPPAEVPAVEQFETATAKEGDVVIVVFGTRDIKAPNVVWYGDIKTVPIKSEGGKK